MTDATALEIVAWGLVVVGLARALRWYVEHRCRCCHWRLAERHTWRCTPCWTRFEDSLPAAESAPREVLRETGPQFLRRHFTAGERGELDRELDELLAGVRIRGEVDR